MSLVALASFSCSALSMTCGVCATDIQHLGSKVWQLWSALLEEGMGIAVIC